MIRLDIAIEMEVVCARCGSIMAGVEGTIQGHGVNRLRISPCVRCAAQERFESGKGTVITIQAKDAPEGLSDASEDESNE